MPEVEALAQPGNLMYHDAELISFPVQWLLS